MGGCAACMDSSGFRCAVDMLDMSVMNEGTELIMAWLDGLNCSLVHYRLAHDGGLLANVTNVTEAHACCFVLPLH